MNSFERRQSPSDAIFLHLILLVFIQCCIIRCRTSFDPLIKRPLSDLYIAVNSPTNEFVGWELWWRISESNR